MTKYYRVIKDTPLWEVDAIISNEKNSNEYRGIEDIWDKHEDMTEYLSAEIVEVSPDFFQRVYKNPGDKLIFKTADQLKKLHKKFIE